MIIERLDGFTSDGYGNVISGDVQDGDVVRIDGKEERRWYAPVNPATKPVTMTDKQFRNYAALNLGSASAVGAVWKAAKDSTDADVQYAFMAWSKADTYDKADVAALTAALVAGNCMTTNQRTALLGNWPTT